MLLSLIFRNATGQWPGLPLLGIEPTSVRAIAPLYLGTHGALGHLDRLRRGDR